MSNNSLSPKQLPLIFNKTRCGAKHSCDSQVCDAVMSDSHTPTILIAFAL